MNAEFAEGYPVLHVSDVPPAVEGSHTVLYRLWAVGDLVEKPDQWGGSKRYRVTEIGWDSLWPGMQAVTLSELHKPGRYVGCDPFSLRSLAEGRDERAPIRAAAAAHARAQGAQREIGHWRDQKDAYARKRWQAVKREAAGTWTDLHNLRTAKPAVLLLMAPKEVAP